MTKELESLETYLDKRIKDIKNYLEFNERSEDEEGFTPSEELQICYLAKRMLAIDNANPSEALEKLDKIGNYLNEVYDYKEIKEEVRKDIDTIKQSLLKSQEQEKVLKIIFEKGFPLIEKAIIKQSENYEQYCIKMSWWNNRPFTIYKTEEEFNLLKRWTNGNISSNSSNN